LEKWMMRECQEWGVCFEHTTKFSFKKGIACKLVYNDEESGKKVSLTLSVERLSYEGSDMVHLTYRYRNHQGTKVEDYLSPFVDEFIEEYKRKIKIKSLVSKPMQVVVRQGG
jgi:hypothetical protein